jgi:hypothetical protein
MATAPNSRTTPASAQASPTDLAKLWEKAFKDYDNQLADCRKKPSDVRLQNVRLVQSLEDVKNSVDEKSESFTNYRHDKSALDKVRHFIGENLGYVQFIGDQAIGAATASFPPAGVIWTVATFAIKVCQTVSSDFDKLLGLLGETGSFLRSLQIIETKVPHNNIYQVCVTECLVAIVSVYAVHTKFMLQSRKAAFAHALWRGNDVDPELKDAYDNLHSAINKLTTANSMMVIRNSEDLKDLMAELKVDIRFDHDSIMSQLYTQTVAIYETKEAAEQIKTMVGQVLGLLESKKNPDMEQSETMAEEHMSVAYLRVKAFLDPPADQITRLVNIQHSFIAGTEDFVVQNPQFQEWLQRKHSYFWIHGDSGTGKSHLAYAITMELKRRFRDSKDVSVAYFLFDRNMSTAFNFRDAFRSICLQVAGQDKRYRETLASRPLENSVLADKDNSTIVDLWDFLIPDFFAKDGQSQVFLVLDSVDKSEEVKRQEVDHIVKSLLREIVDKGLHIQVLLTSDDRIWPELDGPIVNLTPAECRPATEKIIGSRLKTLPRLSQFRPRTKQQIRNSLYQINSSE